MDSRPLLIGIAGGSGSGKTTLLSELVKALPKGSATVLTQDNYYLPQEHQVIDAQGETNFDLPQGIDRASFVRDILALKRGEAIQVAEYTFNNDASSDTMVHVPSANIIVTEGLFVFHFSEVFEQMDLSVFVDAPEQTRLQRRINRDAVERGYDEADVRYRWKNHVLPAERAYLDPYRNAVDLTVDNSESYHGGVEAIVKRIQALAQV